MGLTDPLFTVVNGGLRVLEPRSLSPIVTQERILPMRSFWLPQPETAMRAIRRVERRLILPKKRRRSPTAMRTVQEMSFPAEHRADNQHA